LQRWVRLGYRALTLTERMGSGSDGPYLVKRNSPEISEKFTSGNCETKPIRGPVSLVADFPARHWADKCKRFSAWA
jgi:hypothetical protein